MIGVVTLSDLQRAYDLKSGENAGDICTRTVITAEPSEPLWAAIRRMSAHDVGRLPVVDRATGNLVGLIGRHGVMRAYNIAYARKLQDQHTAETVRLNTLTGGHVIELHLTAKSPLVGKRISQVHWPPESIVAAIWRDGKLIMPHGSTDLRLGDTLTMVCGTRVDSELRTLIEG
jgi:hypothetical protein